MTTRYVLTAENDSSDPPDTIHLVYGAESNWQFMAQRGSRDYPITPDGLRFLAAVLREHGYRVEPGVALGGGAQRIGEMHVRAVLDDDGNARILVQYPGGES